MRGAQSCIQAFTPVPNTWLQHLAPTSASRADIECEGNGGGGKVKAGLEEGKAEAEEPERTEGTARRTGERYDEERWTSRRIHRSTDRTDTLH